MFAHVRSEELFYQTRTHLHSVRTTSIFSVMPNYSERHVTRSVSAVPCCVFRFITHSSTLIYCHFDAARCMQHFCANTRKFNVYTQHFHHSFCTCFTQYAMDLRIHFMDRSRLFNSFELERCSGVRLLAGVNVHI